MMYNTADLFFYQTQIASVVVRYLKLFIIDLDNPLQCNRTEVSMHVTESGRLRSSYKECVLE